MTTRRGVAATAPGDLAAIHPTATVADSATIDPKSLIGEGARIGANAEIGSGAEIGMGAWIGESARIGDGVRIGHDSLIEPGTVIESGAQIGAIVRVEGSRDEPTTIRRAGLRGRRRTDGLREPDRTEGHDRRPKLGSAATCRWAQGQASSRDAR